MLAGAPLLLEATVIKTGRSGRNHWNSQVWELNQRFEIGYDDFSHEENKPNYVSLNFCSIHSSYQYEKATPSVWYFHTQALWSSIVVFDSTVTVRLHVALPQRQLSKALLSQLWVTQTASGTQKGSAVLMIPGLFAIQMRSVLQTDAKWKEWKVFSLESSLCLTAHTMLLGRKSQKMSWTNKWKAFNMNN